MRAFTFVLQYVCIAFAIYLCYRVGSSLYLQDYVMMDIVANVGTIERSIPGYWRFDATAAVDITDNVALRVNVQNLTNKRYYDRTYTTHFVTMAPGRSAFATLSLKY